MFEFTFVPKTEEEINELSGYVLLPEGTYPFYVKEITSKVSQALNPMLEVKLCIPDNNGERVVIDFLLPTDRMIFKLKHFCEAIGMEAEYAHGSFDYRKCVNRGGKVKIVVQKGKLKPDNSGYYPDKNAVKDYVPLVKTDEKSVAASQEFNDDIIF